jgi:hypothetical protein
MADDEYEKKYMGGGEALARSKAGMPWWFHLLIGMACCASAGAGLASGTLASLVSLPILLLVWILFLYLRVTVTADTVHVQLGVFGPRVPIADILDVVAEKYSALKYGGWGIRFGLDGSVAYSVPGHGGRGIRIRYKKKNGGEATIWVTSPDPEALVAAIERARAAKGVRIAESLPEGTGEGAEETGQEELYDEASDERKQAKR